MTTTDGPLASRAAGVLSPIAHLQENLQAQSIVLSSQEMRAINDITGPR